MRPGVFLLNPFTETTGKPIIILTFFHFRCVIKQNEKTPTFTVGAYEQDGDTSNGKETIEWLILEVKGNQLLLLSKYALDYMPYTAKNENITWSKCTLRRCLNNDFFNTAFTSDERVLISRIQVTADINTHFPLRPQGVEVEDEVFLLSFDEVNRYFDGDNSLRVCVPTQYAIMKGPEEDSGSCAWWLRTMGQTSTSATYIYPNGEMNYRGITVSNKSVAVRPAIWIDLSKLPE